MHRFEVMLDICMPCCQSTFSNQSVQILGQINFTWDGDPSPTLSHPRKWIWDFPLLPSLRISARRASWNSARSSLISQSAKPDEVDVLNLFISADLAATPSGKDYSLFGLKCAVFPTQSDCRHFVFCTLQYVFYMQFLLARLPHSSH